ncbi:Ig-like domain repeat protein [Antrihabitans sp. YC3-6]|uniref:Ig-like domain repeat protein n=1 Tax=Antrihabitans stalagmiti TaxID=2799499 RepID=A0A934U2N8_9NOCA|nr:Ig-like domain-containing protein [Antrihabitans stalagmiti]MBJ8339135.1 Ig-like domain repeat protein [Antrihabitans stalagmiti]
MLTRTLRAALVPAAAVAALIVGAPSAAAINLYTTETTLTLPSGPIGVGCAVTLTATVSATPPTPDAGEVRFGVNGSSAGNVQIQDGVAKVTWIPTAAGEQNVSAFYTGINTGNDAWGSSYDAVDVTVVSAVNTGSGCIPLPF